MKKSIYFFCLFTLFTPIIGFFLIEFQKGSPCRLYQEKRGWPIYIVIKEDTAYYERRQADKISFFTDFDTLIREKTSDLFLGQKSKLVLKDTIAVITRFNSNKKGEKDLIFLLANEKQVKRWDSYKNADKYVEVGKIINKKLWPSLENAEYIEMLGNEWKALSRQINKLNQNEFDSAMNNFKVKYLIQ